MIFLLLINYNISINLIFLQKYIIILCIIYDIICLLIKKSPGTGESFCDGNDLFTGYSFIYHINRVNISFLFFLLISKIILIIQIIIGMDLIILRLFLKKIKYNNNFIYIVFILIPGIIINLYLELFSLNKIKINFYIFIYNYIFINIGFTGKIIVNNALILKNNGEIWEKYSGNPKKQFYSFLIFSQKHSFNDLNKKYGNKYTYL